MNRATRKYQGCFGSPEEVGILTVVAVEEIVVECVGRNRNPVPRHHVILAMRRSEEADDVWYGKLAIPERVAKLLRSKPKEGKRRVS